MLDTNADERFTRLLSFEKYRKITRSALKYPTYRHSSFASFLPILVVAHTTNCQAAWISILICDMHGQPKTKIAVSCFEQVVSLVYCMFMDIAWTILRPRTLPMSRIILISHVTCSMLAEAHVDCRRGNVTWWPLVPFPWIP